MNQQSAQQNAAKPKGPLRKKEKEPFNPTFDKRLMRRRWSQKEIVMIIHDELERMNGKLAVKIREVVNQTNGR